MAVDGLGTDPLGELRVLADEGLLELGQNSLFVLRERHWPSPLGPGRSAAATTNCLQPHRTLVARLRRPHRAHSTAASPVRRTPPERSLAAPQAALATAAAGTAARPGAPIAAPNTAAMASAATTGDRVLTTQKWIRTSWVLARANQTPRTSRIPVSDQPDVPRRFAAGSGVAWLIAGVIWHRHRAAPSRRSALAPAIVPLPRGLRVGRPAPRMWRRPMAGRPPVRDGRRSVTVAGTRTVRTTKVSRSIPTARPNPTASIGLPPGWRAETTANTAKVPASTRPAEVTVDPVAPTASTTASRSGQPGRLLPDPGHDEDVVVLAQRQQEDEHEERQDEGQHPPGPRCR